MIRRRTIRPARATATRWTAWALRLAARHERLTSAQSLPLTLHVRLCRVPLLLYQRWLSFSTQVQPHFKLSIAARDPNGLAQANVYAPQILFLQSFTTLFQRTLRTEVERRAHAAVAPPLRALERSRAGHARLAREGSSRPAMSLTVAPVRTERLSSVLDQHFSVRREAVVAEVSRRLTERVRRVEDMAVARPSMALRNEPLATTAQRVYAEAAAQQSAFEREGRRQVLPAREMTELSVEQLANQVLKQIDRRVVARRERMGQI